MDLCELCGLCEKKLQISLLTLWLLDALATLGRHNPGCDKHQNLFFFGLRFCKACRCCESAHHHGLSRHGCDTRL